MKKNLGAKPFIYPQPVLIVASYGEDGAADAMNVAYGGIVNSNRLQINIGVRHKTADNIKLKQAFTVGIADVKNLVAADYVGMVSGHDVPNKVEKAGFHVVKSEFVDAPIIEELPISMECKVEEINQYNQTLRIVAEIVNVCVEDTILLEDGGIDVEKLCAISLDPANHAYLKVSEKVGSAFADGNQMNQK
jgi:flavin reductase (DIM6/NTAB) family NADH-FMN oxidoreductase RutF